MASWGGEWSFKSMSSASTHGLKKSCASVTIRDPSSTGSISWKRCNVEICWWNATVLMSFKVAKMALRYYQQEFREWKFFHLLLNWMWKTYPVIVLRWLCESDNTPQKQNQSGERANNHSPRKPTKGSITSHIISGCRDVLRPFGCLRGNAKKWYWVCHSPIRLWL